MLMGNGKRIGRVIIVLKIRTDLLMVYLIGKALLVKSLEDF